MEVPVSPIFATLKELLDTYLAMPQVDKERIPDFVNAYPKNLLRTIVQYVDVVS